MMGGEREGDREERGRREGGRQRGGGTETERRGEGDR